MSKLEQLLEGMNESAFKNQDEKMWLHIDILRKELDALGSDIYGGKIKSADNIINGLRKSFDVLRNARIHS